MRGLRVPLAAIAAALIVGAVVTASLEQGGGDPRLGAGVQGSSALTADMPSDRGHPLAAMETEEAEEATAEATPLAAEEPGVTDRDYMRHVCLASAAFQRGFDDATRGIQPENAEAALTALVGALAGPLDTLARDLEAAEAPNDLEQWHNDAVHRLRETAQRVRGATRADELSDVLILRDGPFPRPPRDVEDRLRNAAGDVPECAGMVMFPQGAPG